MRWMPAVEHFFFRAYLGKMKSEINVNAATTILLMSSEITLIMLSFICDYLMSVYKAPIYNVSRILSTEFQVGHS